MGTAYLNGKGLRTRDACAGGGPRGAFCRQGAPRMSRGRPTPEDYKQGVLEGDRRMVAKAITLLESRRSDDLETGRALLEELVPHTGGSTRVGITGPPGVGKSTLIETLGLELLRKGHSLAVLAVDPTSKTILLVSKQRSRKCHVYAIPWPEEDTEEVAVARKIARLKVFRATGMDVSADGLRAIVSTYGDAYEYRRGAQEDWAEAFSRKGRKISMPPLRQGEAICYGPDGKRLYLTSEKLPTPFWEVPAEQSEGR